MFYGHQGVHPKITKCIQSNDLYKKIKDEDLLELDEDQDVTCRPLSNCPAIKDDNDSSWPDEIKEIWPYYIHGVSRAWLRMIELFAEREEKDSPRDRFREKIDLYDKVNYLIEEKWVSHGEHAMLHHLNAVFGYKHINILRPHGLIRNINPVIATSGEQQVPAFLMEVCF